MTKHMKNCVKIGISAHFVSTVKHMPAPFTPIVLMSIILGYV